MGLGFLDHMRAVPDHRIPGMVTYPLDEILLVTLVGVVCGADDWKGIEEIAKGALDWLRGFLPFRAAFRRRRLFTRFFRLLDTRTLAKGFAAWAASVRAVDRQVVAVDGKTLRGSKKSSEGTCALHLVSAYATEAGLVLGQWAVDGKSNEIKAIPELLDMLNLRGAIVIGRRNGDAERNRGGHRRQGASTRGAAPRAARRGSTPDPKPFSPPCAPIGASKTTCIGPWA